MKIPAQYLPVMPYLIVNDSRLFLDFAIKVFKAEEQHLSRYEDGQVQHGELRIGQAVIMFSQATEQWKNKPASLFLYVENVDTTYEAALHHGAVSLMPPAEKDYGYNAGFEDPLGNQWWIVEGEKE